MWNLFKKEKKEKEKEKTLNLTESAWLQADCPEMGVEKDGEKSETSQAPRVDMGQVSTSPKSKQSQKSEWEWAPQEQLHHPTQEESQTGAETREFIATLFGSALKKKILSS